MTQKKQSDSKSNNTTQQPTQNTKQIEQSNSNSQGNNSGQKNNVSTSFNDSITGEKKKSLVLKVLVLQEEHKYKMQNWTMFLIIMNNIQKHQFNQK